MTKMIKMALLMIIMVEIMMIKLPWLDASCSGDWPNNRHWFPIPSHPPSLQNQSHHHHHHHHYHHHHHRRVPQLFTEQVSKNCNPTGLWTMPFVWYTHFKQIVTNLKKRKPIRNHRNSQISLDNYKYKYRNNLRLHCCSIWLQWTIRLNWQFVTTERKIWFEYSNNYGAYMFTAWQINIEKCEICTFQNPRER